MIIYFSATGNTKHVAHTLAAKTGDSIHELPIKPAEISLGNNESLGIVLPTYFLGIPSIARRNLSKLKIHGTPSYCYVVTTYGNTAGYAAKYVEEILQDKNIALDAAFNIRTVNTFTPVFNTSDQKRIDNRLQIETTQLDEVCKNVIYQTKQERIKSSVPKSAANIGKFLYDTARHTSMFTVNDTCIGCGLCESICPAHAIEVQNDKPVWIKDECTLCLGCVHHCPTFSIQYGRRTEKHGQYIHP